MKARIKGTNIIVECIDTGTLINENKGIECKHSNGATEVIPGDCLIEIENDFDWQSFRAEATKDILCSVILTFEAKESFDKSLDNAINNSIKAANKLISKLKENEETINSKT